MKFTITITRDEDGIYIADYPAIPGCMSQGKTEEEAQTNIHEPSKSAWKCDQRKRCR
jgi:predicted RNase H-like HicB family nuclease